MKFAKCTPAIGAELLDVDMSSPFSRASIDYIHAALMDSLVIFIRDIDLTPADHLNFARAFGQIDAPHPHYPHVDGFEQIVVLENDKDNPPDTNSWHTDLTFKSEQPFASILVARRVPPTGGDTLWSSCYAAFERLPDGLKRDLKELNAVHDFGDFRNDFAIDDDSMLAAQRLDMAVTRFGHAVKPLIGFHPVTGRPYLNFNEAFVTHIVGLTTNESNSLKMVLANHMNRPEDQVRWRWQEGDLAMWDNRVTMHYAVADYMPAYRCMNRVTVVDDKRV